VHEKKVKKKLSVSFAFTHTYTFEKLTLLLFSPKRTWKIGELLCEAATSINSCVMEGFKEKSERAVC